LWRGSFDAALGRLNSVGDFAQSHFHFAERSVGFGDGAVGSGNERRLTLRFTGGGRDSAEHRRRRRRRRQIDDGSKIDGGPWQL